MKKLQSIKRSVMLAPVAAATTQRTANLDCTGADYASIQVVLGAELNTNSTNVGVRLLESDSTVATTFATFNSSFQRTIDNTAAVVYTANVDLRGARKKNLRIELNPDTTTNGPVLSCVLAELSLENENASNASNGDVVVVG
jgi:hypothetical protein